MDLTEDELVEYIKAMTDGEFEEFLSEFRQRSAWPPEKFVQAEARLRKIRGLDVTHTNSLAKKIGTLAAKTVNSLEELINMKWLPDISGKTALNETETFHRKMEEVYAAVATRITELLDHRDRLKNEFEEVKRVVQYNNLIQIRTELDILQGKMSELESASRQLIGQAENLELHVTKNASDVQDLQNHARDIATKVAKLQKYVIVAGILFALALIAVVLQRILL